MMKKAILMLAAVCFAAVLALPVHAGKSRTLTVLFTGDLLGQVTPKHK
ncbi:MAG: hypothetical protein PHY29_11405 [Syntrophales bacterium]|nr:hypothetical protein [Syntrophales bacterium]